MLPYVLVTFFISSTKFALSCFWKDVLRLGSDEERVKMCHGHGIETQCNSFSVQWKQCYLVHLSNFNPVNGQIYSFEIMAKSKWPEQTRKPSLYQRLGKKHWGGWNCLYNNLYNNRSILYSPLLLFFYSTLLNGMQPQKSELLQPYQNKWVPGTGMIEPFKLLEGF